MPNVDWTWFILGIITAMFILPFVQGKLTQAFNRRPVMTTTNGTV